MSFSSNLVPLILSVMLILPVISVVLLIYAFWRHRLIERLLRVGRTVKGNIIELETESFGRNQLFRVHFQFYAESNDANKSKWVGKQIIGTAHFNRLKIGDQVIIHYLPTNPVIS